MNEEIYTQEELQEITDNVNLYEYVCDSTDIEFKKHSGNIHYCECVFHNEKTASLAFYEETNSYHCYGCGETGNLINWLRKYEHLSFKEAVEKGRQLAEIDTTLHDSHVTRKSSSLEVFKNIDRTNKLNYKLEHRTPERQALSNSEFEKYADELPQEWLDEGILADVMKLYEIRIDKSSNRIVYPVYDNDGNLISVKGRTLFASYKLLKIQKYLYYFPIGSLNFFVGFKQAAESIKEKLQIIIVEGIKSAMKIYGFGYHNVVSAETSDINYNQVVILLQLHVKEVVVAFDKDIKLDKIKKNVEQLKKFTNVYAVIDSKGLLGEKDSPCDKGKEVWEQLYESRIRI